MINWSSVFTNVVSTALAALVVGAFAIIWQGATSINDKVNGALKEIKDAQAEQRASIDVMALTLERFQQGVNALQTQAIIQEPQLPSPSFPNINKGQLMQQIEERKQELK